MSCACLRAIALRQLPVHSLSMTTVDYALCRLQSPWQSPFWGSLHAVSLDKNPELEGVQVNISHKHLGNAPYLYVDVKCQLRTLGRCTVSLCRCNLPTQRLPSPHRYHNAVTKLKLRWHCPVCLLQSDLGLISRQGIEVWSSQTCKGLKPVKSSSHLKCVCIQGKSHRGAVDACAATGCLLHHHITTKA